MKRLLIATAATFATLATTIPIAAKPTSSGKPTSAAKPLLVLIDVGHGGVDKGATKSQGSEKEANLGLALKLKAELERRDVSVVLSRGGDKFLSLQDRVALAAKVRPDCLVSLHAYDKTPFRQSPALEVTYFQPSGKSLAQSLSNSLKSQSSIGGRTGIRLDRQRYYILRQSPVPSAFVTADLSAMLDAGTQDRLARGIADGVESFGRGLKR